MAEQSADSSSDPRGAFAAQKTWTAGEVDRAAASLAERVTSLAQATPEARQTRAGLEAELSQLRRLFRSAPALFAEDVVTRLQDVARVLREPPTGLASPEDVLQSLFGYPSFRPGQREIIDSVLAGRDCVGVMPTGAGKSLTYQIPARILGGTTLVVSPLIALMKDQVDAMNEVGMRATFLNSSVPAEVRAERLRDLLDGRYELLYAAPEGLEASVGGLLGKLDLRFVAIDEAHCISQWGHDFRPAYRNLARLRSRFRDVPILALTATATPAVTRDIVEQLAMRSPRIHRGSFFRPNLHVHVYKKGDDARESTRDSIATFVRSRPGDSGIVYCLSRRSVDSLVAYLTKKGVKAAGYHAGMSPEARSATQDAFQADEAQVVVATVAFGMGIDKSNVRYVVHRDMPKTLEGYYQEIGRAGRDGLPSDCVLFYSWADVIGHRRLVDTSDADDDTRGRHEAALLEMFRFADTRACRHRGLAAHFAERIEDCGVACDVCAGSDVLAAAQAIATTGRRALGTRDAGTPFGSARSTLEDGSYEVGLFEHLRALRMELARAKRVPAYVVFNDATLVEMAKRKPKTLDELRAVPGIGPKKLVEYGDAFLELIEKRG